MPFSSLYAAVVNARNHLYRKGIFKSFALGAPTFSVGNITVGGTGKTPLVAFVAEALAERGEKVCILTRGYKRENASDRVLVSDGEKILADVEKAGDEPFELANKLLGKAIVVADRRRAEAGIWARETFGATAFVLDDGFQHLRVRRDLDIVCIDATNPFGSGKTLPGGILREPLQNLQRAGAIVITRANLAKNVEKLRSRIETLAPNRPVFAANSRTARLTELQNLFAEKQNSAAILEKHDEILAFCALGNPENFFEQLRRENFRIAATEIFPDHHFYSQNDIDRLVEKAEKRGARALLTTVKDGVKLKARRIGLPCFIVETTMVFENEKAFRQMIFDQLK